MVDVRYLKLYHTHYGKDDDIGDLMLTAQKQSFFKQRKGHRDYRGIDASSPLYVSKQHDVGPQLPS